MSQTRGPAIWRESSPELNQIHNMMRLLLNLYHLSHQGGPGESACNAGDPGSIPELGRSPGEGIGNSTPNSCLENSMDRGAWLTTAYGVTKSWIGPSDNTFSFIIASREFGDFM